MATIQKRQYFLKDKKAMVYKPHKSAEGDYYTPVSSVDLWCYTRQLSQDQIFAARVFVSDETRYFVFNFRADIDQYDIIKYKGNWFTVTRTDTTDDYNGELFVYVKNLKFNTVDKKIKPYGYQPAS